ncbi:unnamed protein product [Caenorhabditis brenneri]
MEQTSILFAMIRSNFVDRAMRYKIFEPCMCVIDHAAQVMETQTLPAVIKMKRIVLAGDPKQLQALVLSPEGKAAQLEKSIMDRIIYNKEKFSWIMLKEQYRCHPAISVWSNKSFYRRELTDKTNPTNTIHSSFKTKAPTEFRTLFDAAAFVDTSAEFDTERRSIMYEVVSGESPNELGYGFKSFKNEGEAQLVLEHYEHLRELGIQAKDIAIISPYNGQIELLTEKMETFMKDTNDFSCKQTTIGTAERVQGQEYDCVIFSMVRSNPRRIMGFVCDLRRLNVVMTRAKRHLMFIGNGYLMASSWYKPIRDLFHEFNGNRHRFHPQHVRYTKIELNPVVRNNFGNNFDDFVKASNDPEMKAWCADFVLKQHDPEFQQQQQARRIKKLNLKHDNNVS